MRVVDIQSKLVLLLYVGPTGMRRSVRRISGGCTGRPPSGAPSARWAASNWGMVHLRCLDTVTVPGLPFVPIAWPSAYCPFRVSFTFPFYLSLCPHDLSLLPFPSTFPFALYWAVQLETLLGRPPKAGSSLTSLSVSNERTSQQQC